MYFPLVGEIRQFAGDFVPQGWALCEGQLLPVKDYEALFSLIRTQFGGDGQTTFALPDLRGRIPLHTGGKDLYPVGSHGGQEEVTLTEAQLPAHTHIAYASSNATPNTTGPENAYWGSLSSAFTWGSAPGDQIMHADTVKPAGAGHAHENRMPFVTVSYIIALQGIFPNRS